MELVCLGKVVKLHGIIGQMKIVTKFNNDFDIKNIKFLFDENGNQYKLEKIFSKPDAVVVKLENVDLEKAKMFMNKKFFIDRELVSGKILFEDLKGSIVKFEDETILGKIEDVQDFGSAEIVFVKLQNEKELLFPCVKGIIKNFDYKSKILTIDKEKLKEVSEYED